MLTDDQVNFVVQLAGKGRYYTDMYHFPLTAMVACACLESGYGTSAIYRMTNCPFNLQKPTNWQFPYCDVLWLRTYADRAGTKAVMAPFCKAVDLRDAARLFCEWIMHYPNPKLRDRLIAVNSNATEFARKLPLVGFGASLAGKNPADEYANFVNQVAPIITNLP